MSDETLLGRFIRAVTGEERHEREERKEREREWKEQHDNDPFGSGNPGRDHDGDYHYKAE